MTKGINMTTAELIRIPKYFYDDHVEMRDLPAPDIVRQTKQHYFIDATSEHLAELYDDATFHVETKDGFFPEYYGLCESARATARAIEKYKEWGKD